MTYNSGKNAFKRKFKKLLNIDDYIYSLYSTYGDPISGKINQKDRNEIVKKSNEVGKNLAQELLFENSKMTVKERIKSNNIKVVIKEEAENIEFVYFGTYDSNGPITLFQGNIKKSEKLLKNNKIDWISINEISDIILTHELFHYYEDLYPNMYTNTKEIKLWKLGSYIHQSKLICPSEIAAMAFTKELLNLDFNPEAINYLLYSSIDKKKGEVFFNNITSLNKKWDRKHINS